MEDTHTKKCNGDCMTCSFQQRVYCAAQLSRNNMDAINEIKMAVSELSGKVDRLGNTESDVFNPMNENVDVVTETQEFENAQ